MVHAPHELANLRVVVVEGIIEHGDKGGIGRRLMLASDDARLRKHHVVVLQAEVFLRDIGPRINEALL